MKFPLNIALAICHRFFCVTFHYQHFLGVLPVWFFVPGVVWEIFFLQFWDLGFMLLFSSFINLLSGNFLKMFRWRNSFMFLWWLGRGRQEEGRKGACMCRSRVRWGKGVSMNFLSRITSLNLFPHPLKKTWRGRGGRKGMTHERCCSYGEFRG